MYSCITPLLAEGPGFDPPFLHYYTFLVLYSVSSFFIYFYIYHFNFDMSSCAATIDRPIIIMEEDKHSIIKPNIGSILRSGEWTIFSSNVNGFELVPLASILLIVLYFSHIQR